MVKAAAKQGGLNIQSTLITIYANSLSAIATQAALIAGFAFQFVITQRDTVLDTHLTLAYFYYTCYTICLVGALFALSQATVTTVYGPWMAFNSVTDDAVQSAHDVMRSQATFVVKIAVVSITALFLGVCLQTWSIYDYGIAAICTLIYIVGYILLIYYGRSAYIRLRPKGGDITKKNGVRETTRDGANTGMSNSNNLSDETVHMKMNSKDPRELKEDVENTALEGTLFVRETASQGGNFCKRYVTLSGGRLDIYKGESDRGNHKDPITIKPIKLYQYKYSENREIFARKFMNIGNVLKEKVVGTRDFYIQDVISSPDVNLDIAREKYSFALEPVHVTELSSTEVIEFVATDAIKFNEWKTCLEKVTNAYEEMRASKRTKDTMRTGGNYESQILVASAQA